jgi:hypothetical protein
MHESDQDYFGRRAREERLAAESARHPHARRAHLELADRYAEMSEATRPAAATAPMPISR